MLINSIRNFTLVSIILLLNMSPNKEIILCWQNEKDINEIDQAFIKGLKFYYVKNMQQVLDLALV